MVEYIETPDLPAKQLPHSFLRFLELPILRIPLIRLRRWQLRSCYSQRQFVIETITSKISELRTYISPVICGLPPVRVIYPKGAQQLSSNLDYAQMLTDLDAYNDGKLLESEFGEKYGIATSDAFDTAFNYLFSFQDYHLCEAFEETTLHSFRGFGLAIAWKLNLPTVVAMGVLPSVFDTLYPNEFASWNPTEPIWDSLADSHADNDRTMP